MKVNESENQKKESWLNHQKMYKSYQEIEKNAKTIQSKLKKSIEKARWVVSDIEIIGIDISNIFPMELPDIPCLLLFCPILLKTDFLFSIDVPHW